MLPVVEGGLAPPVFILKTLKTSHVPAWHVPETCPKHLKFLTAFIVMNELFVQCQVGAASVGRQDNVGREHSAPHSHWNIIQFRRKFCVQYETS
jgi:hypothetical protein